jgi:endonuclease/exonuclease/phosphatase family metal-dependent hydrolase
MEFLERFETERMGDMQRRTSWVFSGCMALLQACVTSGTGHETLPAPVTVMSWNVENLFDTVHDEGKNDWTYLPLAVKDDKIRQACKETSIKEKYYQQCISKDWNENILQEKLQRLAKVILSQNQGKGADLLFLCEVENIRILERLRQEFLQAAQYQTAILLEGSDERGIDCAFLSRLPLDGSPTLHKVPLTPVTDSSIVLEKTTRDILQADFKLPGGERLTALAVHFPAGFHPTLHRREALARLNEVAKEVATKSQIVVAAGDFNINENELELYDVVAAKDWLISHREGCKSCPGSYFYEAGQTWSFLDAIMVYKGGLPPVQYTWTMDPDSIRVVNENHFQKKVTGHPLRFTIDDKGLVSGVSDHFPILMQLKAKKR